MNDTPNRILVVDDEPSITEFVSYALKKEGFYTDVVDNGEEALALATKNPYDLFVLDIMLPGMDGYELCRRLRSKTTVPVLFLSARDTELDKVVGLDTGADDYVVKPFGVMELLSRVKAVLRRSPKQEATHVLTAANVTLDPSRRQVTVDGESITLTRKEFDLLETLMRNRGLVMTREKLLDTVWGIDFPGDTRTVDVHMGTLRQKLGAGAALLQTVRGVGYRMED